ncbi:hypothetical protein HJC23_000157 [Cyclotella cryptica]|uniref:PDZ domain-containing protein n=1 Tax=Cyclotella cryptica TaxID=29204 RepID=A0ABD3NIR5_9STRA|eukprot:CCRYP_021138-RA/>CCRYP_021138-RA protein AED:0.00 eAED:0.00 QI:241/1/1/1/1/1/3/92/590
MKTRPRRRRLVPLLSAAFAKPVSSAGTRRLRQHHGKMKTKSGKAVGEYLSTDGNNPRYELWASLQTPHEEQFISVSTEPLSMSLAGLESMSLALTLPNLSFLDISTTIDIPFDYSWNEQGGDEDALSLSMPNMSMTVDEGSLFWGVFETFDPTTEPTLEPTTKPTSETTAKPTAELTAVLTAELTTEMTTVPTIEPTAEQTTEQQKDESSSPIEQGEVNSEVSHKFPTTSPRNYPYSNPTAPPQPTSNLTQVPTGYLVNTATTLKTKEAAPIQFQMRSMLNTMNDYELLGIFQPSCEDYLTTQLMYDEPEVSNIQCKVTNQQLIITRRQLNEPDARRLDESSALLVDINVTGAMDSKVNFYDVIQDAFVGNMGLLINALKNKGEFAGINTFDELYSMDSIQQTNDKNAITSSDDSNDEGAKTGALIVVVTGAASIMLLIGAIVYYRLKSCPAKIITDDDEGSEEADPPPEHVVVGSKTPGLGFDFGLGFLSSPDPGSISSDDELPKIRREIIAPPGKLGVITDDSVDGPIVHSVRDDSPLKGLVFPGDLIVALDDEDTSELSSHNLTKLVASRSKFERKITALSDVFNRR